MNAQGRAPIIGEIVIFCGASLVMIGLGAAVVRHEWLMAALVVAGLVALIIGQRLR